MLNKPLIVSGNTHGIIEALNQYHIQHNKIDKEFDKDNLPLENPNDTARTLSMRRAMSFRNDFYDSLLLGIDSVSSFNGQLLQPINDKIDALYRIQSLSGLTLEIITGYYMISNGQHNVSLCQTDKLEILVKQVDLHTVQHYLKTDDYKYRPSGIPQNFIERMEGHKPLYYNGIYVPTIISMAEELQKYTK